MIRTSMKRSGVFFGGGGTVGVLWSEQEFREVSKSTGK